MNIIVDQSMKELGVSSVVVAYAKNVDPKAQFSDSFLQKQAEIEKWALEVDINEVIQHPNVQGYISLMQKVGRSIKKNPPTIPSFVRNIQHRGGMPHINTIVDIYNVESLRSLIAIGGHDFDKIQEPLIFTVSQKEDEFYPILSTPKHVAKTDYVYKDAKGILAWMGVRDGENYKFDDHTKNAIFIVQGNGVLDVRSRIQALKNLEEDLRSCIPNLEFSIEVIEAN
ncbi:B3/4 domain-containing protein [Bulleidia extructa]|uniref:B3/B4 domain-containing protein n=1 Tax=Bulleidia extructa TaxID=118748 RepID=UPI003BEFBF60